MPKTPVGQLLTRNWRGGKEVGFVFPASVLNEERMGHLGFEVGPLLAAIPSDAFVVNAAHQGDCFYDFIVFREASNRRGRMKALVVSLAGYAMANASDQVGKLADYEIEALKAGSSIEMRETWMNTQEA